jgi:hypothetical protein
MKKPDSPEFWLRGPVPGIPPLLQPVAHALLQAREEVNVLMEGFPEEKLWERPAGVAAVGFHLRHLTGVLDRLLTYARGEALDRGQLDYLAGEGGGPGTVLEGVKRFNEQIDKALDQISGTPEDILTAPRYVGRDHVPSTVVGLLFHAAEHTQRHTGQLLVTVRVLNAVPDV